VRALVLLSVTWLAGVAPAAGPRTQPDPGRSEARALLAGSLAHQARSLGHLRGQDARGRAGRVLAMLRLAERLRGDIPQVNRQLAALYEELADLEKAAAAARRYVRVRGDDYAMGVRLIRLAEPAAETADDRAALLKGFVADEHLSAAVRAFASAKLAGIYRGQGEKRKALAACEQALALDPLQPAALRWQAGAGEEKLGPAAELRLALARFRADPRGVSASWEVARLLQAAGLATEALSFHRLAHRLSQIKRLPDADMEKLLVDYFNAMLDAGQADEAVKVFEPMTKGYARSRGLHALMVEAYRAVGNVNRAKAEIDVLRQIYAPLEAADADRSPRESAELAWFYTIFAGDAGKARQYALEAARAAGEDPGVRLALGASSLKTGKADEGVRTLAALVEEDPYAAAILAEHYLAAGKDDAARAALKRGAGELRSGPGWRRLEALAKAHKVSLPPAPHAGGMREALAGLPAHVLDMARSPERAVRLSLAAATARVRPGEPVAVTLELENISAHRVPLGASGLLNPVVYLGVSIEADEKINLPHLTPVPLPAPRYLAAGAKVRVTARVDVGAAERALRTRPLQQVTVTVSALPDPLEHAGRLFSSVPELKVAPAVVTREALFDAARGKVAAEHALGYIVRDLKRGDLRARLRAARQTGGLYAHVGRAATQRAEAVFPEVITRPVLLSMTRAFLRADAAAVRAEMLAALRHADLDDRVIGLMGPLIEDRDAAVRLRLIDLLAAKRTSGHETLLDYFARDDDPLVRQIAAALRAPD